MLCCGSMTQLTTSWRVGSCLAAGARCSERALKRSSISGLSVLQLSQVPCARTAALRMKSLLVSSSSLLNRCALCLSACSSEVVSWCCRDAHQCACGPEHCSSCCQLQRGQQAQGKAPAGDAGLLQEHAALPGVPALHARQPAARDACRCRRARWVLGDVLPPCCLLLWGSLSAVGVALHTVPHRHGWGIASTHRVAH